MSLLRRPHRLHGLGSPALVAGIAVLALAGCGGSSAPSAASSTPTATAPTTTVAASTGGCRKVAKPSFATRTEKAPTTLLPPGEHVSITFETNCGDFTIAIAQASAPHAAASFVALAKRGYFNHTIFHRIVPGFVIQGGDPTGTGTGGPGYTTVDTVSTHAQYTEGVVAMAKTTAQVPGTAGSQFFIVTEPNAGLQPIYAIIGTVTSGRGVVEEIGELGSDVSQKPTRVVEITKATVSESG